MEKIDSLDRKILQIVMQNARIPSKDVAGECGVSRAAIHQRIQRMIDMKVITGSGYHVNPKVLGFATCILHRRESGTGVPVPRRGTASRKDTRSGRVPLHHRPLHDALKLYARDNEHLMVLLNDKIQTIPGVTGTETLISLDHSIDREIPITTEV